MLLVLAAVGAVVLRRAFPRDDIAALEPDWDAVVSVIAGDGVAEARDGDAYRARFADPFGVAVAADGTIYVADGTGSHRIRRISPDGIVTTLAGGERGFRDGVGQAARFDTPSALALDATGGLYVADTGNNAIRRIGTGGIVTTIAGDGTAGYRDGPAREARFNGPVGVAVDASDRVVVADTYNDRIRVIEADATLRTIAPDAGFHTPSGVAVDGAGNVYVADTGNGLVRIIRATGDVSAATAPVGFVRPVGIAATPSGDLYVTDELGWVGEIRADGSTRTLAGSTPGFRDGAGRDARFRRPSGVAVADAGRLVVTDSGNALVRLVAAPSRRGFAPPPSSRIEPRFDVEAFRLQPLVWPVAPIEGPHEVAGTVGEARGEGVGRMHLGVDIRADQGTLVHAMRPGVVTSPVSIDRFGLLDESVRIGPVGYVHLRVGRARRDELFDPTRFVPTYDGTTLVDLRLKRGARFVSGDAIGTVNAFNHVHLNVGWPGEEYNPLAFRLVQFEDSVAPVIASGGLRLYDEEGRPLTRRVRGRVVVSGSVQIVVDAWDQANESRPGRRLGLYDLGYQVLNRDGRPAPGFETMRHTIRFDRLASDPEAARLVYAAGSGIPFYGNRRTRFLYIVTNTLRDGVAARGSWDTTRLAPGDYVLRVWAADINGNVATANRDLPVTVQPHSSG